MSPCICHLGSWTVNHPTLLSWTLVLTSLSTNPPNLPLMNSMWSVNSLPIKPLFIELASQSSPLHGILAPTLVSNLWIATPSLVLLDESKTEIVSFVLGLGLSKVLCSFLPSSGRTCLLLNLISPGAPFGSKFMICPQIG